MAENAMKSNAAAPVYDIVVAGGGITGAGVFHEAVRRGYKVLLVEARDFAWGTSSRSSKMVHGGLRYLKQGKFRLTKAAVREREALLKEYAGLVTPLNFMMPLYSNSGPSLPAMKLGLSIYSTMAGKKQHKVFSRAEALEQLPFVKHEKLNSAVGFRDAQVDDARLVLRLIADACSSGGDAKNYTGLEGIERDDKGKMTAVRIKDMETGQTVQIKTRVLINATGPFAEALHASPQKGWHIRQLRGSHLIFSAQKYRIDRVISFIHPEDRRPVFLFPWEGRLVLGTTDVDHDQDMDCDPHVSATEAAYLMQGMKEMLPGLNLIQEDCIASIAGVRPVLSRMKESASKESREHVVWKDKGLVTVTGGKLTTFRLLAKDALKAARAWLPQIKREQHRRMTPGMPTAPTLPDHVEQCRERLQGRYGIHELDTFARYDAGLFERIAPTEGLWVELCQNAAFGKIRHLSDLMLRRLRIGLLLKNGGSDILDRVEQVCGPYLDWDENRWENEKQAYQALWQKYYAPPQI